MDDNDYSDDGDIFGLESGSESESDSASELSAANADEDEAADEQREIDEEDEDKDEALLQEAPEDEEESEEVEPRPETVPALQWSRSAKQQFTALSEVCFDTEVVRQLLESKLPPNAVVSKETALAASALTKMAILKILQKTAQQRREAKRRRKECKLGEPVPKKRKPARRITAADISNTLLYHMLSHPRISNTLLCHSYHVTALTCLETAEQMNSCICLGRNNQNCVRHH